MILLLLIIPLASCVDYSEVDYEDENLNGRVKSYALNTYNATQKFGKPIKGLIKKPTIFDFELKFVVFNEAGNLVQQEMNLGNRYVYDYNDDGNRVGLTVFDKIGKLATNNVYELDSQLKIFKISTYNSKGDLISYTRNLYNENEKNYESVRYDDKGAVISRTENVYEGFGNLKEKISYDKDERISSKYFYTYDSISGNKLTQKHFKTTTTTPSTKYRKDLWQYFTDVKAVDTPYKDWSSGFKKKPYGQTFYLIFQGLKGEKSEDAFWDKVPNQFKLYSDINIDGFYDKLYPKTKSELVLVDEVTYKYNSKDDLVLKQENGELKEYKYDYDELENWVVKYEYENGIIKYITERNIEYFK